MLYLLRKDLKELFGSKKRRIAIMIAVLIILIISTYYNVPKQEKSSGKRIEFGLDDKDGSVYSKMLIEYFKESESFASYIHIVEGSSQELEQSFYNGDLDIFLQIPEGFAENMIYLDHLPVKVLINTADITKAVILKNILESYEKYIRAVEVNCVALYDTMQKAGMDTGFINKKNIELSYDLIFTALGKESFFKYRETSEFPATSLLNYYSFALLSVLLNFMGLYVGFLILKEKNQGALKRLITIGVPIAEILIEKILFSVCLIFIMISLVYILPNIFNGNAVSFQFEILLLLLSFFVICFAVFLSGFFHKVQNYMIAGNFFCFIFSIIGGGIIPIMYLPGSMLKLSSFTPNYWLIRVMLTVQKGIAEDLFLKIIFGLIISSFTFYVMSIYLYGREEVYYEE
ncbi:MAG: ABC transporter permease [Anaerocolumna sp.]